MKIAVFSSKSYDVDQLQAVTPVGSKFEYTFLSAHLNLDTVGLARDHQAICCFVNDTLDSAVVVELAKLNVKFIALRCAGFNNVDIDACKQHGIVVARVPEYSPCAVAEHAVALILSLNRNIHRAFNRVRENDYSLNGLVGFNVKGKTVGVVGGGKIGIAFIHIMRGFGCRVLCFDPNPSATLIETGVAVVGLDEIWTQADIVSLHCPLTSHTHHLINDKTISKMKTNVMLINTSRGALIDTPAVISGLKQGKIGYLGLDVYEEEADLFFEDYSNDLLQDDIFARLTTFKNVLITGHQGFFTQEALQEIAKTTVNNLLGFQCNDLGNVTLVCSSDTVKESN